MYICIVTIDNVNMIKLLILGYGFIECFTTTFLYIHSWLTGSMRMIDDDDVGLKEKPEDTRLLAYAITKTQTHRQPITTSTACY